MLANKNVILELCVQTEQIRVAPKSQTQMSMTSLLGTVAEVS